MLRRWCMALALTALTAGLALTATSASAAPTAAPAGAAHVSPGGLADLMGVSAAHTRGLKFEAQSTNWSGYAGTTGRYTSVSASWTQRPAPAAGATSTPPSGSGWTATTAPR